MYRLSALSRAAKPVFQRSVNIARPNTFRATSIATFHTSQKHLAKSTIAPEATDGFLQGGAANYIEEIARLPSLPGDSLAAVANASLKMLLNT
ncbi:unnamed protein product [Cunninghamella blakesleeana]